MSLSVREIPIGVRVLQRLSNKCPRLRFNRDLCYQSSVLFLTYIAYMCYHLSRKPISVVKNVLHQNCVNITPPANIPKDHITNWCDWAPFDGSDTDAAHLFGTLDSAFLFAYALGMFISGFIAERINLRYFLALGMLGSGIFSYLFGIAKSYGIHSMTYFVFVQVYAGIFQTTGWPGVVTVVGNWFGKTKRGLIFGIWNSHTSIGNILGSLIAAEYVETDWSLSFIIPGIIIGGGGFIIFLFLVVSPSSVGCTIPSHCHTVKKYRPHESRSVNYESSEDASSEPDDTEIVLGEQGALNMYGEFFEVQRRLTEHTPILLDTHQTTPAGKPIGFVGACRIPGVIEFSLSLFFAKLVSYTFLYWLPNYISASTTFSPRISADISTLFDVGGIIGAIAAGSISDYSGMSATTCVGMLLLAAPMMFVYQQFGTHNLGANIIFLIIIGILVNGPYALITTAVSAELGTHSSLEGNSKALATVTAIIDGTGSIGAAVGPLLAAFMSSLGWEYVFYMLIASDLMSSVLLLRLFKNEVVKYRQSRRVVF